MITDAKIQRIIYDDSKKSAALAIIPNVFYNDLWEADVLKIDKHYHIEEFEIKCSKFDYKADFGKVKKHEELSRRQDLYLIPNMFTYVCEEGLIPEDEVPEYAGLVYVVKYGMSKALKRIKKSPMLHNERIDHVKWEQLAIKLANRLNENRILL